MLEGRREGWKNRKLFRAHLRFPLYITRCYLNPMWWWGNLQTLSQRTQHGVSWFDAWDFDDYILEVMYKGVYILHKDGWTYPGIEPWETPEKWHEDLINFMADIDHYREVRWLWHEDDITSEYTWDEIMDLVDDARKDVMDKFAVLQPHLSS